MLDNTLQELEGILSPRQFYRVNRQLLVNIEAIRKVHSFLGGRLKLELAPATSADTPTIARLIRVAIISSN